MTLIITLRSRCTTSFLCMCTTALKIWPMIFLKMNSDVQKLLHVAHDNLPNKMIHAHSLLLVQINKYVRISRASFGKVDC